MPYGPAQIALVEQVDRATPTRRRPGRAGASPPGCRRPSPTCYGGEPAKVVRDLLLVPGRVRPRTRAGTRDDERPLLWHFKYMVNALTEVPRDAAGAHLRACSTTWSAGTGTAGTACTPSTSTAAPGRPRTSATWRRGRRAGTTAGAPRRATSTPTAPAATRPARRRTWPSRGRDEEAVALAEPVLAGQLTCSEQPQAILTALLCRTCAPAGSTQARDAHRRAYRLQRGQPGRPGRGRPSTSSSAR